VRPPAAAQIDSARRAGGYRLLRLRDGRLSFDRPGVQLDLGAAAKGYIVDRAVALLRSAGVPAGVVEAGGDLRFWGHKPDGRPWRFGVQHPRDPATIAAVDDVGLPALATSGDYEQTFEYEGWSYHHLLDPASGYPAERAVSATVWAPTALAADALATAAFVAGPGAALEWAADDDSLEVLVYYEVDGELTRVLSAGLEGRIETTTDSELTTP
jgi:thiamine biosynthesis lipoprotein